MTTTDGTIKRITDKGFCTGMPFDDWRQGQTVSFTVGQGPKGPRAENVTVR